MKGVCTEFLNTYPLIWYFEKNKKLELIKTTPAECAYLFNKEDIKFGIIPVGAYPYYPNVKILANPCIASINKVGTVKLYSNKEIINIDKIFVDQDSITSVILLNIILKLKYKKSSFKLIKANLKNINAFDAQSAYMMIGDKNFNLKEKFLFNYDLAYEWVEWVELPFVFACWMLKEEAIKKGIVLEIKKGYEKAKENFENLCTEAQVKWNLPINFIKEYFTKYLSYEIGNNTIKSINLFFSLANKLDLIPEIKNLSMSII